MNEEAEKFRKITMKVLTMQLNSVTIMDVIAYGGAALGVIMAVTQYMGGAVSLQGAMLIILLSADFFIPMRQLGSFFHIAMNGMAASDKIFRLLELPENRITAVSVRQAILYVKIFISRMIPIVRYCTELILNSEQAVLLHLSVSRVAVNPLLRQFSPVRINSMKD